MNLEVEESYVMCACQLLMCVICLTLFTDQTLKKLSLAGG